MDYAVSSVENLILLMASLHVVSVAWLCLIMSIFYAAYMEPLEGKLVPCWECVLGENLLPLWK